MIAPSGYHIGGTDCWAANSSDTQGPFDPTSGATWRRTYITFGEPGALIDNGKLYLALTGNYCDPSPCTAQSVIALV